MNSFRIRLKFIGSCLKQEDIASFTPKNVVNLSIVCELGTWSYDLKTDFTSKDCLFGSAKINKILIHINTNILDKGKDSNRVQNFYYLMVAWAKMSLFFSLYELICAY